MVQFLDFEIIADCVREMIALSIMLTRNGEWLLGNNICLSKSDAGDIETIL
jgi:hypothetical protein